MDMTNSKITLGLSPSCQHFMMKNKGRAEKSEEALLALGEQFKQDASSFQIIPVMGTMDSTIPTESHIQLLQNKTLKDSEESSVAKDALLKKLSIVKCTSCDKSVALLVCDKYNDVHDLLCDETRKDGWFKVESEEDRLVLFVLNQIIYKEYEVPEEDELQVEYAFPLASDITKILWMKGKAIGFYSVKPKGSLDLESMDWYRMTVLDTLFIRNSERRKGYALSAIKDILHEFPDQNIGFSTPISLPMVKVLKKYLVLHPDDRMKLWEVYGCGTEGNCQILWFQFRKR